MPIEVATFNNSSPDLMMSLESQPKILVLGVGNSLLCDDGFGIHVVIELEKLGLGENVTIKDGGTIGLSLLPEIEDADHLIVIDCSNDGGANWHFGSF